MKLNVSAAGLGRGMRWLAMSIVCVGVASCSSTVKPEKKPRSKEYFSEKEYGVPASPRVASGSNIPKGGGRYIVGNPYVVKGKRYEPKEDFGYDRQGLASWYGSAFHGRQTANGEVYDQQHLSAAHPTFPLPSYARVTNTENGSSVIVRVNDRGPFHPGRIIDVSSKTADLLDLKHSGTGQVRVQYVGRARMDGHDMPYLMASYVKKGDRFPSINPEGQIASGVMVASNETLGDQLQSYGASSTQTSLAGNTPSAPYPASQEATSPFQVMEQFVMLPDFGPVPFERPQGYIPVPVSAGSFAAAYAAEPSIVMKASESFEQVLGEGEGLTEQSILSSYKRRQASAISPN